MNVFKAAAQACTEGIPTALATVIHAQGSTPRTQGARMLIYANGSIVGSIGGGALEKHIISLGLQAIQEHKYFRYQSQLHTEEGMHCAGDMEIYVEPLHIATPIFIFGAGHVAHALSKLLPSLNYTIHIIDDRTPLITHERFPNAQRHLLDPLHFAKEHPLPHNAHFVLIF